MNKILNKIIIGLLLFFAGALTYSTIFPRTVYNLNGKIKQRAKRSGTNLVKDIDTDINLKKPLKRAKNDKKFSKRKNKKL